MRACARSCARAGGDDGLTAHGEKGGTNRLAGLPLDRALRLAVALAALWYPVLYVYLALTRIGYPFELEWMEGGALEHVRRLLAGQPIYGPPKLAFVPFMYTPLYFYIASLVTRLTGDGFLPLRAVSLGASLASFALIFLIVRRETQSALAGIVALSLFAATYDLTTGWFDLGRVDSLFLCLYLAALYLVRFHESTRADVFAAVLLTAAFLTKQTALLLSLPVLFYVVYARRRRSVWFAGAWIATFAASNLALYGATGGWYAYYVFKLPEGHSIVPGRLAAFWVRDVIRPMPIACLLAIAWFASLRRDAAGGRRLLFYALVSAAMIGGSWASRAPTGGWANVLIPEFAALSILSGLAVGHFSRPGAGAAVGSAMSSRRLVLVAAFLQLVSLAYNPSMLLPKAGDEEAGRKLVARIRAVDGPVWVPSHGYLVAMAGKPATAHEQAVIDVILGDSGPARRNLVAEYRAAIASKKFRMIIADTDWLKNEIEGSYTLDGPAIARDDTFWPASGGRARPRSIYLPKEGPAD